MTTYTVTIEGEIFHNQTATQVKTLKKNMAGYTITVTKNTSVKNEAIKFHYYRGEMVSIIEGRQNGYTLVHNFAKGTDVFANTAEIEYK
jgi:hypothetical protein